MQYKNWQNRIHQPLFVVMLLVGWGLGTACSSHIEALILMLIFGTAAIMAAWFATMNDTSPRPVFILTLGLCVGVFIGSIAYEPVAAPKFASYLKSR